MTLAPHQLQMSAQSIAGAAWGLHPGQALAVDHAQDRPVLTLRAGFIRMVTSNLLPGSISVTLRGRAKSAAPRLFHSERTDGCTRFPPQSLADQNICQCASDLPHVTRRLSSSAAFAGSQTSEALNGRVPNSSGAFQKSEGELPNVCC